MSTETTQVVLQRILFSIQCQFSGIHTRKLNRNSGGSHIDKAKHRQSAPIDDFPFVAFELNGKIPPIQWDREAQIPNDFPNGRAVKPVTVDVFKEWFLYTKASIVCWFAWSEWMQMVNVNYFAWTFESFLLISFNLLRTERVAHTTHTLSLIRHNLRLLSSTHRCVHEQRVGIIDFGSPTMNQPITNSAKYDMWSWPNGPKSFVWALCMPVHAEVSLMTIFFFFLGIFSCRKFNSGWSVKWREKICQAKLDALLGSLRRTIFSLWITIWSRYFGPRKYKLISKSASIGWTWRNTNESPRYLASCISDGTFCII